MSVLGLFFCSTHYFKIVDCHCIILFYSKPDITFNTPAARSGEPSTVDLIIQASPEGEADRDVGPRVKLYPFEYRPNPILEDIQPRTTILR